MKLSNKKQQEIFNAVHKHIMDNRIKIWQRVKQNGINANTIEYIDNLFSTTDIAISGDIFKLFETK